MFIASHAYGCPLRQERHVNRTATDIALRWSAPVYSGLSYKHRAPSEHLTPQPHLPVKSDSNKHFSKSIPSGGILIGSTLH